MPHTRELLDRLREALELADAANDYLVGAHISTPIEVLESRLAEPPEHLRPSA